MNEDPVTTVIEPGVCPKCGCSLDEYRPSEPKDETIEYPFTCVCGVTGPEIYRTEYFETIVMKERDLSNAVAWANAVEEGSGIVLLACGGCGHRSELQCNDKADYDFWSHATKVSECSECHDTEDCIAGSGWDEKVVATLAENLPKKKLTIILEGTTEIVINL
jgi:hypothetical protein